MLVIYTGISFSAMVAVRMKHGRHDLQSKNQNEEQGIASRSGSETLQEA